MKQSLLSNALNRLHASHITVLTFVFSAFVVPMVWHQTAYSQNVSSKLLTDKTDKQLPISQAKHNILDKNVPKHTHLNALPATQWDERTLNAYLNAEFLASDGDFYTAATVLWPQAQLLKISSLFEKTAVWAIQAKRYDLAYDAANLWEQTEPNNVSAQEWLDFILVLTERHTAFSERLHKQYAKADAQQSLTKLASLQLLGRKINLNTAQHAKFYQIVKEGLKAYDTQGKVQYLYASLAAQAKLKNVFMEHLHLASVANPPSTAAIAALLVESPQQAIGAALLWTQRSPKTLDAWRTLGLVYAQLKHPIQAEHAFTQALYLTPKDVPLLLERMEQLRLLAKPEAARVSLLAAYAARDTLKQAIIARLLGEQLEEDFFPDEALTVYEIANTLSKQDANINSTKNIKTAVTNINTTVDNKNDNVNEANGAQDEQSEAPVAEVENFENILIHSRILALEAKRGKSAALDELLQLQAHDESLSANLRDLLTRITIYTLRDLGRQHKATDPIAVKHYEQALLLCTQLPEEEGVYEQAVIYEIMGNSLEAEKRLRSALQKSPDAPHLLNTLGYGLVDRNASPASLAEGTQMLEKANTNNPNNMAILDSLGWAYFRAKQYDKALPLLQKAYDLKRDPEVAAHLGELLFVMGKLSEAHTVWNVALQLHMKHPVLLETVQRFKQ